MTERPSARQEHVQSAFAKRLAADPVLAERCEKVAEACRSAAEVALCAVHASEILTEEDFSKIINAQAGGQ